MLTARVQTIASKGPTPPFANVLLGGAATLRGMRAGSFVGDDLVALSAELRVPFTSPLRVAGFPVDCSVKRVWTPTTERDASPCLPRAHCSARA